MTIRFFLLLNRQGQIRLAKWFHAYSLKERSQIVKELASQLTRRGPRECNFLEWKNHVIVYRRYASVYFVMCIDRGDNELISLEILHFFCTLLDKYFGNVCELDLIYSFDRVYNILDEFLLSGEILETSREEIIRILRDQDSFERSEVLEQALSFAY